MCIIIIYSLEKQFFFFFNDLKIPLIKGDILPKRLVFIKRWRVVLKRFVFILSVYIYLNQAEDTRFDHFL